ncbi:MAG: aspartyl protease family protein [Gammaproteobacteria bacterium]|jgi:predicted aspartyl protease
MAVLAIAAVSTVLVAQQTPPIAPPTSVAPSAPLEELKLEEVKVTAPEPRYVAPTLRDRIGRIWAPVTIDGKGPLRLVLDTGASRSALTPAALNKLGIQPDLDRMVLLRGTTGSARVPTVRVGQVEIGDLLAERQTMVVVDDAFGGADGVLATTALRDRRILADFRRDRIEITRSSGERAPLGFTTLRIKLLDRHVPWVEAMVGGVRVKAVIDTGAQSTIGNLALRDALLAKRREVDAREEGVIGVTGDLQEGRSMAAPAIQLERIMVRRARINFVDLHIFQRWQLRDEPAMLLGMDVIGVLDTVILDYRRRELQVRLVDR